MPHARLMSAEIDQRGQELYNRPLALVRFGTTFSTLYSSHQAILFDRLYDRFWDLCKRSNDRIRPIVETEDNLGKLIVIDVETGDYEIEIDQNSLSMSKRMHARHPGAALIQFRIGYDAVVAFGGVRLRPSKRE